MPFRPDGTCQTLEEAVGEIADMVGISRHPAFLTDMESLGIPHADAVMTVKRDQHHAEVAALAVAAGVDPNSEAFAATWVIASEMVHRCLCGLLGHEFAQTLRTVFLAPGIGPLVDQELRRRKEASA